MESTPNLLAKLMGSIQVKKDIQDQLHKDKETCCTCFDKSEPLISICQYRHDHKMCVHCAQSWIARHRIQYEDREIKIFVYPDVPCHICRRLTCLDTIENINRSQAKLWEPCTKCTFHNNMCKTRRYNALHRLHCFANTFTCERCDQENIPFYLAVHHFVHNCV